LPPGGLCRPRPRVAAFGGGEQLFADVNARALAGLRALGVTHVWLAGCLRQATLTDYPALGMPADVVTPAALQENYRKEMKKHVQGKGPKAALHTLETVARRGGENLTNPLLILDEAHRIRNPGKGRDSLRQSPAEKRLALTGSLLYNHPSDIAGPINFAAGDKLFPEDPTEFGKI
jgi:hypothetical protein